MDIVERLTYKQLADGLWKAVNKLEKIQRGIIVRYKHKNPGKIAEENLSGARVEQIEKGIAFISYATGSERYGRILWL